jgi:hypothetical protein
MPKEAKQPAEQKNKKASTLASITISSAIAARLRVHCIAQSIGPQAIAMRLGVPMSSVLRQLSGVAPMQLSFLYGVADLCGLEVQVSFCGKKADNPLPSDNDFETCITESPGDCDPYPVSA